MKYVLLMYLASLADSIQLVCVLVFVSATITFLMAGLIGALDEGESESIKKAKKYGLIIFCVTVPLLVFTPNQKTIHTAIVVVAGEDLAKSEIGGKAYKALNSILDQVIKKSK